MNRPPPRPAGPPPSFPRPPRREFDRDRERDTPRDKDGPRINEEITVNEMLVIDDDGEKRGVLSRYDALQLAQTEGLDLVEVAPQASPPVVKLMDYGKFKYQEQKKAAEARKKQKVIEVKEIKMRPAIDDHDYDTKMKAIKRFFEEGDKVKITLRFKGREMQHSQLGMEVLQKVKKDLEPISKIELEPRFEGRQMIMIMAPR
ncbi:MAG TPA: translation initiation factor IF-3 [Alphaproteobacteria bacterium]|nr:translation initiation factor IF-3 [Alphaproteobacteria bacterium]HAJ45132.1 translation initiation factor IF-3 [Alphaproteobacteria bacterium]